MKIQNSKFKIKNKCINHLFKNMAKIHIGFVLYILIFVFLCQFSSITCALDNPEQELTEVVEDYVLTRYPDWIGLEVRTTFKHADRIFEDLRGINDYADFEIVEVYEDFKPVGNVIFPIKLTAGEISKKIFVRAKVEVFDEIVVAKNRINRGERIEEKDLTLEERDIAMLPENYFRYPRQILGTEAKTTIPKNSTIFEWMVKEMPLVHRGEEIAILVTAPNLLVKTQGVLLEDGYLGKTAKVKRSGSKKTLEGILVSSKEIEVKLK